MKTVTMETPRLRLRAVEEQDVQPIFDCWMQDEAVSRYMWWKAGNDIAEARDFVAFELEQRSNDSWNRWILELRETGEIIGTCLLFENEEDEPPHWDISYNLGRAYWEKGYTTEAMRQVLAFAKGALKVKTITTTYALVNTTSANVLHKLGFVDEKELPYECSGGEMVTRGMQCTLYPEV